ncbi:MAG: indole-3-glycerol phosphate synthase TrpC [Bacillota bacterium]|nr:indole-3-glycerol phosphate synthase TrpC [Bacillota bacterium]
MILERIAASTKIRIERQKAEISFEEMKNKALSLECNTGFPFEKALKKQDISFICEVKKASPSKGVIAEDFPYIDIAKDYEKAGADAVSVLTEPEFFLGSDNYLSEIKKGISIPVLRKDFTLDAYQIYEAKVIGADAVLLICSLLDTKTIREFISICDELGLSALVEAHDEAEIDSALKAGARIIGVNNRNLRNFDVDINNSILLRKCVPQNVLFVAESGIQTAEDVETLRKANVNAVLIGETLMCCSDKEKKLKELRGCSV